MLCLCMWQKLKAVATKECWGVVTCFNGWKWILEKPKQKYCLKSEDKQLHDWVGDVGASS